MTTFEKLAALRESVENAPELSGVPTAEFIAYIEAFLDVTREPQLFADETLSSSSPPASMEPQIWHELFQRWPQLCNNAGGRKFLRYIVGSLQKHGGVDTVALTIDEHAHTLMRKVSPDIFYAVNSWRFTGIELPLLLDIERKMRRAGCRKTPCPDVTLQVSAEAACGIDFFKLVWPVHMRWFFESDKNRNEQRWAIPPRQRRALGHWYVPQKTFLERLVWLCPFVEMLMASSVVQKAGAVLIGSLLPLCALSHEPFYVIDKESFVAFATESYRKWTLDLLVCGCEVHEDWILREFLPVLRNLSGSGAWKFDRALDWREDDGNWIRNRSGTTFYLCSAESPFAVQVICMPKCPSVAEAVLHQHLPCVRAWFDGTSLRATASCFMAWMTRYIDEEPLPFGAHVTQQRRSKIVLKYAMRGWGFSMGSVTGLQFPDTVMRWLEEWPTNQTLPPYHPLYNPNTWPKYMPADKVQQLIACSEI